MPNTRSSWSASGLTDSVKNLNWRNARGHLCEVICAETLIRQGYWVYSTTMLGPVDLVAIRSDPMEVRLLDVKSERTRSLRLNVEQSYLHWVRPDGDEIDGPKHRCRIDPVALTDECLGADDLAEMASSVAPVQVFNGVRQAGCAP